MPVRSLSNARTWQLLVTVLLLGLFISPVVAQITAAQLPTRFVADSIHQIAVEDTTYAVQRLFRQERRTHHVRSILYGAGLGFNSVLGATRYYKVSGFTTNKVVISAAIGAFGFLLTRSVVRGYAYRKSREQRILADLERGQPLPRKVRQKLKPSYFDMQTSTK